MKFKDKIIVGAAIYGLSVSFNYASHFYDTMWAARELSREPIVMQVYPNGTFGLKNTPRGKALKKFQKRSIESMVREKLINPLIFIPGSYFFKDKFQEPLKIDFQNNERCLKGT